MITYGVKPIVIKNIGRYLLFDPSETMVITSGGSEFHKTAEIVRYLKRMGLVIAIIFLSLYIYFMVTDRR